MPVVTSTSSGDFKRPAVGLQPARCIKIIDLGTQMVEFQGAPAKPKRQLTFQWELPEDKMDDGRPLVISKKINLAIGDKAALTKLAKAATGKEPQVGFDPLSLIGTTCNLTISGYIAFDGKERAGIEGFAPLMKGQQVAEAANEYVVFDLDKFDQAVFDSLHEYYRELIAKSPEYIELKSGKPSYEAAKAGKMPVQQSEHVELDSIPF